MTRMLFAFVLAAAFAHSAVPEARSNDNRRPAGRLDSRSLTVRLEVREATWNPEGENGPRIPIYAFAEEGQAPTNPGPLIRAAAGTRIHVSVRNTLPAETLTLHGFHQKPLTIPPLETRELAFPASHAGIFLYWAATTGSPLDKRTAIESQLSGALVIDGANAPPDRVFVLGHWAVPGDPKATPAVPDRETHVINGKSWPHTERLRYSIGETVRWRWVNGTDETHPLHMHGHYFRLEAKGDETRWAALPATKRRLVATQTVSSGTTLDLSWRPERPGNWLFHCHVLFHVMPLLRMTPDLPGEDHAEHDASRHMAGLVLGITIEEPRVESVPATARASRLRLVVGRREGVDLHGDPGLGYQLAEVDATGKLGAFTAPGPPIVLTRGEPVEIAVENRLEQSTSVHWHGIELESYYDGVPGWGGNGKQITPPIRPGETFVARFTPPRAGTFIYHTHLNDYVQLSTGLYGALIVVDPGRRFDPELDKVFVLSRGGTDDEKDPFLINGSASPSEMSLLAGKRYRLRFIGITPAPNLEITLERDGRPTAWRPIAKDGATPATRDALQPAKLNIFPGETYDFEFQPAASGSFRLVAWQPFFKLRTVTPISVRRP